MEELDFVQPKKTVGKLISVDVLDKIKAEIKAEFAGCDICEWFCDNDNDGNDISEYMCAGSIDEIIDIIDKYKAEENEDEE